MYTLMKQLLDVVKGISSYLVKDEAFVAIIFGLLLVLALGPQSGGLAVANTPNSPLILGICLTLIFALYIWETPSQKKGTNKGRPHTTQGKHPAPPANSQSTPNP